MSADPIVVRTRPAPAPDGPQCEEPFARAQVKGYPLDSWFEQRAAKLVRRGFDPGRCGKQSSWRVGGRDYCAVHAGIAALRILENRGDAVATAPDAEP